MDLSILHDDDVRAIASGDMSKVSERGLRALAYPQIPPDEPKPSQNLKPWEESKAIQIPGAKEEIPEDPSRVNPLMRAAKAIGSTITGATNTAVGMGEFAGAGLAQALGQGAGILSTQLAPNNLARGFINTLNRPDLNPKGPKLPTLPTAPFSPKEELRTYAQGVEDLTSHALNVPVVGPEGKRLVEHVGKVLNYPNQRIDTFVKDKLISPETGQIAKDALTTLFGVAPILPEFSVFKGMFKDAQIAKGIEVPVEPEQVGITKESFSGIKDALSKVKTENLSTIRHPSNVDIVQALRDKAASVDGPRKRAYTNAANSVAAHPEPITSVDGLSLKGVGESSKKVIKGVLDSRMKASAGGEEDVPLTQISQGANAVLQNETEQIKPSEEVRTSGEKRNGNAEEGQGNAYGQGVKGQGQRGQEGQVTQSSEEPLHWTDAKTKGGEDLFKSEEEFTKAYQENGLHKFGETVEEFIRRSHCMGQ